MPFLTSLFDIIFVYFNEDWNKKLERKNSGQYCGSDIDSQTMYDDMFNLKKALIY